MISIKKKFKLNYIYNLIFKENFREKLNFEWNKYSNRFDIINKIIQEKKYKNYLEIGCYKDENFEKIHIDKKIGVDPVSGGTIRATSDNFFKNNMENFDIIFIDGLHHYEQVKKDIKNSINVLNEKGVIILHDCLPSKNRDQMIPRSHLNWNGDVWKAIVEMRTKENVDVYTCLADQGLGIILKRKNRNKLDIKVKDFKKLRFKDYYYNYSKFMNIISEEDLFKIF